MRVGARIFAQPRSLLVNGALGAVPQGALALRVLLALSSHARANQLSTGRQVHHQRTGSVNAQGLLQSTKQGRRQSTNIHARAADHVAWIQRSVLHQHFLFREGIWSGSSTRAGAELLGCLTIGVEMGRRGRTKLPRRLAHRRIAHARELKTLINRSLWSPSLELTTNFRLKGG